ncbi:MAG: NAD(P)/FAD-dependent oxidoreductase [Candidatus Acidiferrales bacterium]
MAAKRDIVILGGGHNALVAAFYLAQKGFKPLVLERRAVVGGAAVTEEFSPGFRCSTLAHSAGPLLPSIARDMQLARQGLQMIEPSVRLFAPSPDGRALVLHSDPAASARQIDNLSRSDAAKYFELQQALERVSAIVQQLLTLTPPVIEKPSKGDIWELLKVGRKIRGLGKKEMMRLLRWGPMAVADFVAEFFENDLLRAAIAARGIFGAAMGPWSAGSTALLLLRSATDPHPAGSSAFPRGGMGALTAAMAAAAKQAGAEIWTGADVKNILVKNGAATGVALSNGDEISANAVVSGADPRQTFLGLLDPVHLPPSFVVKMQHYRSQGVAAKLNLALDALPSFASLKHSSDGNSALTGRIHIGPEIDYLERAFDASKYGEFSRAPFLDITIPSISDPSLAPGGKHVMSIYMQFAPYRLKTGDWPAQRDALRDTIIKTLAAYAPDLPGKILAAQILTPKDLEEIYGLTGGHPYHGELALDQLFTMRPLLGWARYSTPVRGLYLCGSGTHPGNGLTGASGSNAAREILKALR